MDEKHWVTLRDGRRILINNYMNDKIRKSVNKPKEYKIPNEMIEKVYNRKVGKYDENRFYITSMAPDDFLKLTTRPEILNDLIEENKNRNFKLDTNILDKGYMFLQVDMKTGKVMQHEGRHRMIALKDANYKKAEILIFPEFGTYEKFDGFGYKMLKNQQDENSFSIRSDKIIPVDSEYINKIKK